MVVKVSDPSGEAWLSVFNDQAEQILGCTADELDRIKSEVIYYPSAYFCEVLYYRNAYNIYIFLMH